MSRLDVLLFLNTRPFVLWSHACEPELLPSPESAALFATKNQVVTVGRKGTHLKSQLLGKLRKEDHKFEDSLSNTGGSCLKITEVISAKMELSGTVSLNSISNTGRIKTKVDFYSISRGVQR